MNFYKHLIELVDKFLLWIVLWIVLLHLFYTNCIINTTISIFVYIFIVFIAGESVNCKSGIYL